MNDFKFWENYNNKIRKKINKLIEEKEKIYIDLHMHSIYSTDGKQSLNDILENCKSKKLDIISITDHDDIRVYDELYELINKSEEDDLPIIIPGVEFTVECKEYGSQCHILQYYINPKSNEFIKYIDKNAESSWIRVKRQFERIDENNVLQELKNKKGLYLSEEEYRKFLVEEKLYIPEYTTLMEYIKYKLNQIDVDVITLFDMLERDNELDLCVARKNIKKERFKYLRNKYKNIQDAKNSTRLLLSILAVKGADDDFFEGYDSYGSLSVNIYGQLKINELSDKYITIFAHPNYDKFDVIRNIEKYNPNIIGIEYNIRSFYKENEKKEFFEIANKKQLIITIGSDSHDNSGEFYEDMNFYIANKNDIKKLNEWRYKC